MPESTDREVVISIHALHEESDATNYSHPQIGSKISIHALHEESDQGAVRRLRGRPISIHALHEESDLSP